MSLLAASVVLTLAAGAPEPLLIAPYQSLGVEASTVTELVAGFRVASDRPPLAPLPASESDKVARSAVMCGEDGACLATVGQRSGARWVLAFGVGKVGSSLLVSAIFVDVKAGKELMRGSRRVPEGAPDWSQVTKSLADEVVKPPVEPVVVQVPFEVVKPVKAHKFRPLAFVSLGITVAFGLAATLFGLGAMGNYSQLQMANAGNYADLVKSQKTLNAGGDICLIVAGLTGAVALVFFILDWVEKPTVPES